MIGCLTETTTYVVAKPLVPDKFNNIGRGWYCISPGQSDKYVHAHEVIHPVTQAEPSIGYQQLNLLVQDVEVVVHHEIDTK